MSECKVKLKKFELNSNGVRQLLKSDTLMDVCENQADAILVRLGHGYTVTTWRGVNRVNASVIAESPEARRDALENNSILKALW